MTAVSFKGRKINVQLQLEKHIKQLSYHNLVLTDSGITFFALCLFHLLSVSIIRFVCLPDSLPKFGVLGSGSVSISSTELSIIKIRLE